eukprot:INCI5516.1.p1 GENE.INCI5516.1~~INCI5516.1.p1  ORF type:complete len:523 (-),score=92.84 INCI5516.1:145-1713(-)
MAKAQLRSRSRKGEKSAGSELKQATELDASPKTGTKAAKEEPSSSSEKAEIAAEFRNMMILLMVAVTTYGGRTCTKLLLNDLVRLNGLKEGYRFMLLSIFYWSYAPPQLFGGWLAQKLGGKKAMMIHMGGMTLAFIGTGVLLVMPDLDMDFRIQAIGALRLVDGLCQCLYVPTVYTLYRERVKKSRRSHYKAMMSLGNRSARFAAAALEPWLVHGVFLAVAPVYGILGVIALGVFVTFAVMFPPAKRPRKLIKNAASTKALGNSASGELKRSRLNGNDPPVPLFGRKFWRLVLFGPALACTLVQFCSNWIQILVETFSMRFYTEVVNTTVVEAAIYNSSPLTVGFVSPFVCVGLEVFLHRLNFSSKNIRRTHSCLALLLTTLAMVVISTTENASVFLWAIVATLFANGLHTAGYAANYDELGGGQTGILSAFGNSVANLAGLGAPLLAFHLQEHLGDWTLIFPATAVLCFVSGVIYFFFISTQTAPLEDAPPADKTGAVTVPPPAADAAATAATAALKKHQD